MAGLAPAAVPGFVQFIGICAVAVKRHRGQMMRKMRAASVPDLARMALRLGLVPDAPGGDP